MTKRLFKVLGKDGECVNGGQVEWSLPHDGEPGDWMPPVEGPLVACKNSYHLCREQDVIYWLNERLFEAEYRGERTDCDDKIIVREARLPRKVLTWNKRTARLFASDCAEHVLAIFEMAYPDDKRTRQTIATVRRYAEGQASLNELARAIKAVWAAGNATVAVWAVWAAENAAGAAGAAWAAWAARAAWAAENTAGDARDAERKWQTERLMEYLYPESAPQEQVLAPQQADGVILTSRKART